jgi:hypothetical protein
MFTFNFFSYIPPLPNTPPWRGAQLKHRDNFTFILGIGCLKNIFIGTLSEQQENIGAQN